METVSLGIIGLGFGLATGNWVPLQKIGLNSNKIIGVYKIAGVGVTKFLNKVTNNWNVDDLRSINSSWYD